MNFSHIYEPLLTSGIVLLHLKNHSIYHVALGNTVQNISLNVDSEIGLVT